MKPCPKAEPNFGVPAHTSPIHHYLQSAGMIPSGIRRNVPQGPALRERLLHVTCIYLQTHFSLGRRHPSSRGGNFDNVIDWGLSASEIEYWLMGIQDLLPTGFRAKPENQGDTLKMR